MLKEATLKVIDSFANCMVTVAGIGGSEQAKQVVITSSIESLLHRANVEDLATSREEILQKLKTEITTKLANDKMHEDLLSLEQVIALIKTAAENYETGGLEAEKHQLVEGLQCLDKTVAKQETVDLEESQPKVCLKTAFNNAFIAYKTANKIVDDEKLPPHIRALDKKIKSFNTTQLGCKKAMTIYFNQPGPHRNSMQCFRVLLANSLGTKLGVAVDLSKTGRHLTFGRTVKALITELERVLPEPEKSLEKGWQMMPTPSSSPE